MSGIYIHIPFCKQACSYCDFYFSTNQRQLDRFVEALCLEIRQTPPHLKNHQIETLYFGGGTPSVLSTIHLERVWQAIQDAFTAISLKEWTMEMNPEDVSESQLNAYRTLGVDRISLGIQTFNDRLLHLMRRNHTANKAREALSLIANSGIKSVTADLIYGNPGQSLHELESDLNEFIVFQTPHISAYSLTIESRTRLGRQVREGVVKPSDDDTVSEHMSLVVEKLGAHGLNHYEISNFARPGYESIHNSNYWNHEPYLGFGPSAHGFYQDQKGSWIRDEVPRNLKRYLDETEKWELRTHSKVDDLQLAEEYIMLGLRTSSGISLSRLSDHYGYALNSRQISLLQNWNRMGMITLSDKNMSVNQKYRSITDRFVIDLIALN